MNQVQKKARNKFLKLISSSENKLLLIYIELIKKLSEIFKKCKTSKEVIDSVNSELQKVSIEIEYIIKESAYLSCDNLIQFEKEESKNYLKESALSLVIDKLTKEKENLCSEIFNGSIYKDNKTLRNRVNSSITANITKIKSFESEDVELYKENILNYFKHPSSTFVTRRILRTFISHSYFLMFKSLSEEDESILAVKWNLSPSHPRVDICDTYAEQDLYGLGKGVYPYDSFPDLPHPNCLCFLTTIRESKM